MNGSVPKTYVNFEFLQKNQALPLSSKNLEEKERAGNYVDIDEETKHVPSKGKLFYSAQGW